MGWHEDSPGGSFSFQRPCPFPAGRVPSSCCPRACCGGAGDEELRAHRPAGSGAEAVGSGGRAPRALGGWRPDSGPGTTWGLTATWTASGSPVCRVRPEAVGDSHTQSTVSFSPGTLPFLCPGFCSQRAPYSRGAPRETSDLLSSLGMGSRDPALPRVFLVPREDSAGIKEPVWTGVEGAEGMGPPRSPWRQPSCGEPGSLCGCRGGAWPAGHLQAPPLGRPPSGTQCV